jgi:hypothetical protein
VKLDKETIAILPLEKDQHKDDVIYFDELDPGFGIRLRAGGKRTWIVQYRVGAKQRRLTLGTVKLADGSGTLGPAEARKAAIHRPTRLPSRRRPRTPWSQSSTTTFQQKSPFSGRKVSSRSSAICNVIGNRCTIFRSPGSSAGTSRRAWARSLPSTGPWRRGMPARRCRLCSRGPWARGTRWRQTP